MKSLFLPLLLFPLLADAAPKVVKVNAFYGRAEISVTEDRAKSVWKNVVKKARKELNVRIVTKKWRGIKQKNHAAEVTQPIDVYDRLLFDVIDAQWKYDAEVPSILLSAPTILNGKDLYYLGVATDYGCKNLAWQAAAATVYYGNEGELVLSHELGHLLGAEHTEGDSSSVMNWNALSLLGKELSFSAKSVKEVRSCLRRL